MGVQRILFKIFQNLSVYRSPLQFKEIIKSQQKTLEPETLEPKCTNFWESAHRESFI